MLRAGLADSHRSDAEDCVTAPDRGRPRIVPGVSNPNSNPKLHHSHAKSHHPNQVPELRLFLMLELDWECLDLSLGLGLTLE